MPVRGGDAVSVVRAGLRVRCPRCGRGRLLDGMLAVRERCEVCGLDLRAQDVGDGATVFVVLILGGITVGLALLLESRLSPPMWVHLAIWPIFIFGLAIVMLRCLKATLIALQYRYRTTEFDGQDTHAGH
jgi:uncharacterized protein (DUF983 family)